MAPAPPTPPSAEETATDATAGVPNNSGGAGLENAPVFDIEIASYEAMDWIAERIAREVARCASPKEANVFIFFLDDALREALDLRPLVTLQLRNLQESYRGAAALAQLGLATFPPPALLKADEVPLAINTTALGDMTGIVNAAVGLLGLLRGDLRFTGKSVSIVAHAFALSIGRHLQTHENVQFHYPTLFLPLGAGDPAILEELIRGMDAVVEERKRASVQIERLAARVASLKSTDANFAEAKSALDGARDAFQNAETVREEFQSSMTRSNEVTGLSRVQLLERAGYVERFVAENPERCYFLFGQVVAAGGAIVSSSGFFAWIAGRVVRYAGGIVATYGLFRRDGSIVVSRTLGTRQRYRNALEGIEF